MGEKNFSKICFFYSLACSPQPYKTLAADYKQRGDIPFAAYLTWIAGEEE
jgi:hypothetical protein